MTSFLGRGLKVGIAVGLSAAILPLAEGARPLPQASTSKPMSIPNAAVQAQVDRAKTEGVVAGNRAAAIQTIMGTWKNSLQGDTQAARFQHLLEGTSNRRLAEALGAKSYHEVGVILGGSAASQTSGDIGINNLGDTTNDLTYTPINPPCRPFDTRNIGGAGVGPPIPGATIKSWILWSFASMAFQGGNPAGCPLPKGIPPQAASLNLTAVPAGGGASHLRVYPFGNPLVTASFVNYTSTIGNNIANAGIVSICGPAVCAFDINVYNGSLVHYLGDVGGFFFGVDPSDPALNQVKDVAWNASGLPFATIPSDVVLRIAPSKTTHTTAAGDRVHITSTQVLGTTTGLLFGSNLDLYPCFEDGAGTLFTIGGGQFGLTIEATIINTRQEYSVTGVAIPGTGTFNFGMCYRTSDIGWVNNEWGYTSTIVLNPL